MRSIGDCTPSDEELMEMGCGDSINNTQPLERSMKLIEDAGLYVLTVCLPLSPQNLQQLTAQRCAHC